MPEITYEDFIEIVEQVEANPDFVLGEASEADNYIDQEEDNEFQRMYLEMVQDQIDIIKQEVKDKEYFEENIKTFITYYLFSKVVQFIESE